MNDLFKKAIYAKHFFENYCKAVANWRHKMRGFDGNKNEIEFTVADRKKIKTGLKKLFKDLMP